MKMKYMTLLAGLLASSCLFAAAMPTETPAQAWHKWIARNSEYYKRNWGIDIADVHQISSGYMLEFRYRVLDPEKAKTLNDKANRPLLHDEASNVTLSVPALEKIGEIRQTVTPKADQSYFMVFGNPGKIVKPGNKVSIVVGKFRVDGLIVQ